MKKMAVLFLVLTFLVACSGGQPIYDGGGKTEVWIERSVRMNFDPSIIISGDEATLNYEDRTITITGLQNVKGNFIPVSYVVPNMDFKEGKVLIVLPKDNLYRIRIGEQEHILPVIIEGK